MALDIRQTTMDEDADGHVCALPCRWDRLPSLEERRLAQEAAEFLRAIIPVFKPCDRQDAVIVPLPMA